MKKTNYYCDRCGNPMTYTNIAFLKTFTGVRIRKEYDYSFGKHERELCPDCFDSFKEWWSNGKDSEE